MNLISPTSWRLAATFALATTVLSATSFADPLKFTQVLPGGFNVSINGGPLTPSGPITVTGLLDDTTPDLMPSDPLHGEFALTSVTFTGAGYVDRAVATPLSLLTFFGGHNFGFQLRGQYNEGVIGWNEGTLSGPFMTNVNDLSTLVSLPYSTTGFSTFWNDAVGGNAWVLDLGGDTIGADVGTDGPPGTFSISRVPEPSSLLLGLVGLLSLAFIARANRQ